MARGLTAQKIAKSDDCQDLSLKHSTQTLGDIVQHSLFPAWIMGISSSRLNPSLRLRIMDGKKWLRAVLAGLKIET
jgi:hypothetical protein